jgi:hypothetical protein
LSQSSDSNSLAFEEWKKCRNLLKDFDDREYDLRKYGFTFLVALLTADSILLPAGSSTNPAVPEDVKAAVLFATVILIIAVRSLDQYFQEFKRAAATRATVLERILNLELTEIITLRYEAKHVSRYITVLYALFILGIFALGFKILSSDFPIFLLLGIVTVLGMETAMRMMVRVRYPYGDLDWTLDRLECKAGQDVGIMLTNLAKKRIMSFKKDEVLWIVTPPDYDPKDPLANAIHVERAAQGISIESGDSRMWLWSTRGCSAGMYRVHRVVEIGGKRRLKALPAEIRVN